MHKWLIFNWLTGN